MPWNDGVLRMTPTELIIRVAILLLPLLIGRGYVKQVEYGKPEAKVGVPTPSVCRERAPGRRLDGGRAEEVERGPGHRMRGRVLPQIAIDAVVAWLDGEGATSRDRTWHGLSFISCRLDGSSFHLTAGHVTRSPRWYIMTDGQTASRRWRG